MITTAAWCILAIIPLAGAAFVPCGTADAYAADEIPTFAEPESAQENAPDEKPAQQPVQRPVQRQDTIMGTFHEGMSMERDPDTGDLFMRAGPRPEPDFEQDEDEKENRQPIYVTPEIRLPVRK